MNENKQNNFRLEDESGMVIQENTGEPTLSLEEKHQKMDEELNKLLQEIANSSQDNNLVNPRIR